MTVMQEWVTAQDSPEVPVNENFDTLGYAAVYGYSSATSSGLTWGYYGGRWGGFAVTAATLTLTDASTNYIVVLRSTGVISVSTSDTNWNNTTSYARVYRVTTSGGTVSNLYGSDFDYRAGDGGVFGSSGPVAGLSNPMTTLGDIIVGGASGVPDRLGVGTDGQVLTVVSGEPAWAAVGGGGGGGINLGTAVASTSGSSIDFTGIPSGVSRLTVMFNGVSTNGASPYLVQLGDSGGIENSGYVGVVHNLDATALSNNNSLSTGIRLAGAVGNTVVFQGFLEIVRLTGNAWVFSGHFGRTDFAGQFLVAGSKTLSDTLTQVRITTVGGTDTYDAGTINISWES